MKLVDVHSHLTHDKFKTDLPEVIERCKKSGLKAILVSGVNPEDNKEVLKLTRKYDILKASLGIYPIDALGLASDETGLPSHKGSINLEEQFDFFKKNKKEIIAIGEIGLDYKFGAKQKEKQKENFRKILNFAKKFKKPLIIHSRKAEQDILEILESSSIDKSKVVLHCFQGNKKLISRAAELGYSFSIPCIIDKLMHFQMLVEMVDINQLLTETDAPWLSPMPGERNLPENVKLTVEAIAKIKGITAEECANNIFLNYQKMFL